MPQTICFLEHEKRRQRGSNGLYSDNEESPAKRIEQPDDCGIAGQVGFHLDTIATKVVHAVKRSVVEELPVYLGVRHNAIHLNGMQVNDRIALQEVGWLVACNVQIDNEIDARNEKNEQRAKEHAQRPRFLRIHCRIRHDRGSVMLAAFAASRNSSINHSKRTPLVLVSTAQFITAVNAYGVLS